MKRTFQQAFMLSTWDELGPKFRPAWPILNILLWIHLQSCFQLREPILRADILRGPGWKTWGWPSFFVLADIFCFLLIIGNKIHEMKKAPAWAPCAAEQVPTGYLFSTWCICQCYSLHSSHLLFPPMGPQVHSLSMATEPSCIVGGSVDRYRHYGGGNGDFFKNQE